MAGVGNDTVSLSARANDRGGARRAARGGGGPAATDTNEPRASARFIV
jgi:hypothetical protein